jgi:hypothetical protein
VQLLPNLNLLPEFFALPNLKNEIKSPEEAVVNMFFTSGGYLEGGSRKAPDRWRLRPCCPSGISPRAIHKVLYCFLGGRPIYDRSRSMFYRARQTMGHS